jgi:hypothetical protein
MWLTELAASGIVLMVYAIEFLRLVSRHGDDAFLHESWRVYATVLSIVLIYCFIVLEYPVVEYYKDIHHLKYLHDCTYRNHITINHNTFWV